MSIFPTRILLATDGLEEATFAARTAVDFQEDQLRTARSSRLAHRTTSTNRARGSDVAQ